MAKKILVIDDSALMRRVISDIINESSDYEVVGIAKDGVEGFEMISSNPTLYSAIILDINMPKMNGLELLKTLQKNRIEQTVIIVSTVAKEGAKETIEALEYGAFDFVTKPENYLETKGEDFKERIHTMLDLATNSPASLARTSLQNTPSKESVTKNEAATTPVKREELDPAKKRELARAKGKEIIRKAREASNVQPSNNNQEAMATLRNMNATEQNVQAKEVKEGTYSGVKRGSKKLVAIACSTGGPKSLQQVIPYLPKKLDAGVVLVQHMPKGFTFSLAQRLNELSKVTVKEAGDGEVVQKGCVYIAPGGKHLRVTQKGDDYVIKLSDEDPVDGLKPCANIMYESLKDCNYDELTCVVLTGMGSDGTNGIKMLADKRKPIYTIAQDEATCVVYGMPRAIALTGLVNEVVPLGQIAEAITKNVGVS